MKYGSQTQLDKLKMKMSKNSNNNFAKANYGVILNLALFTRSGALWKPNSNVIRSNSLNSILRQLLFFDKTEHRTEKILKEPIIIILRTRSFFSKN